MITPSKKEGLLLYKVLPKSGVFLFEKLLTNISAGDIIISSTDITAKDIPKGDILMENIALTEAVFYILLSLSEPLHGYGIMQNAEKLSNGRVKLAAGTLYGAINTLLEKGWITSVPGDSGDRKKEYVITENGKKAVLSEIERLKELVLNGEKLTGGWNK